MANNQPLKFSMTEAMFRYLSRQIDKAEFGRQTSDLDRRIADDRNLTKAERIVLGERLGKRLQAIVREAHTP